MIKRFLSKATVEGQDGEHAGVRLERVMYSGVSTYCTRSVVVIPAHAGIQAAPRIWIPAYAGMTFHPYIHAPGRAFNMHNTL